MRGSWYHRVRGGELRPSCQSVEDDDLVWDEVQRLAQKDFNECERILKGDTPVVSKFRNTKRRLILVAKAYHLAHSDRPRLRHVPAEHRMVGDGHHRRVLDPGVAR